jgi:hypothetical protein
LGDKQRYEAQKAGAPRTPSLATTATAAVARQFGDNYIFEPHEIYGQETWESVKL